MGKRMEDMDEGELIELEIKVLDYFIGSMVAIVVGVVLVGLIALIAGAA